MKTILHIHTNFLPRVGGVTVKIRDNCRNLKDYNHIILTTQWVCRGKSYVKCKKDYEKTDYAEIYRINMTPQTPTKELLAKYNLSYLLDAKLGNLRVKPKSDLINEEFFKKLLELEYDIVFIYDWSEMCYFPLLLTNKPVIDINQGTPNYPDFIKKRLNKIVVFREDYKDKLLSLGSDADNIRMPIDNNIFKPIDAVIKQPREHLLYVGRIENRSKQLLYFIKYCFINLPNNYKLTIVGNPDHRSDMQELIDYIMNNNLQSRILIQEALDDEALNIKYNCHDIIVNTSPKESYCRTALEALACGKDFVARKSLNSYDWDTENLLHLCDLDWISFKNLIIKVVENKNNNSQKYIDFIKNNHSWDCGIRDKFYDVIKDVVDNDKHA